MSPGTLYVLLVLVPSLDLAAGIVTFVSIAFCFIGAFVWGLTHVTPPSESDLQVRRAVEKLAKTNVVVLIVALVLDVALPNKDDIYMLIGATYVTNIEGVEQLPPNLVGAANAFLERMTEASE